MSDICNLWDICELFPELGPVEDTLAWEIPTLLEYPKADPSDNKQETAVYCSPLKSIFWHENGRDVTLTSLVLAPQELGLAVVKESMAHTEPTSSPQWTQEDVSNLTGDNSNGGTSEKKKRRIRRERPKKKTNRGGGDGGGSGGKEGDIDFEELVKLPRKYKGSPRLPKIPVEEQSEEFRMKVARAAVAQEKREKKRKLDVQRIERILGLRDRVTQLQLQLAAEKQRFMSLKVKQMEVEGAHKNTPRQ